MEVGAIEDLLNKRYPAKILLFGEHIVLDGAMILSVPFHNYGARWVKGDGNESLEGFYDHIESLTFIDKNRLSELKLSGYYLKSDIPRGYGLGSSGALCAAVYEYTVKTLFQKAPTQILQELAIIESYFHGRSSGLDAYVILTNKAIILRNGIPEFVDFSLKKLRKKPFLIDSGISRKSHELINIFIVDEDNDKLREKLVESNNKIVERLAFGDYDIRDELLDSISKIQYEILNYMIVDPVKTLWQQSFESNECFIKLCGAGGGGYYLGFGNFEQLKDSTLEIIEI